MPEQNRHSRQILRSWQAVPDTLLPCSPERDQRRRLQALPTLLGASFQITRDNKT